MILTASRGACLSRFWAGGWPSQTEAAPPVAVFDRWERVIQKTLPDSTRRAISSTIGGLAQPSARRDGGLAQPTGCPTLRGFRSVGTLPTGDNGNVFQVLNNVDSTRSAAYVYDSLNRIAQAYTGAGPYGTEGGLAQPTEAAPRFAVFEVRVLADSIQKTARILSPALVVHSPKRVRARQQQDIHGTDTLQPSYRLP